MGEGARERLLRCRELVRGWPLWDWRPQLWRRYKEFLEAQPMLCNSLTAAALYGTGDCIAQYLEKQLGIESRGKDRYNVGRTLRMTIFGFFLAGPTYCMWYPQLQKMTMAYRATYEPIRLGFLRLPIWKREDLTEPSQRAVEVAVKVMVDNLFFQPPFLTLYFLVMGAMEGLSFSKVYDKTRQNFHDAWGLAVMVWVPVQSLNFWFMPVFLQAPFTQLMNMGWKVGLSLFYHSRDHGDQSPEASQNSAAPPNGVMARGPASEDGLSEGIVEGMDLCGGSLEEQVLLLRARVEAVRARQEADAEAVAAIRAQFREQLAALRAQTEVLAALAEQAERQHSDLQQPLRSLQQQLGEQGRCLALQGAELARLRVSMVAEGPEARGDGQPQGPQQDASEGGVARPVP